MVQKEKDFFVTYTIEPAKESLIDFDTWGNPRPQRFDFAVWRSGYKLPVFVRRTEFGKWRYLAPTGYWRNIPDCCCFRKLIEKFNSMREKKNE